MSIIDENLKKISQKKYVDYRKLNQNATSFLLGSSFVYACMDDINVLALLSCFGISLTLDKFLKNNEYKSKTYDEIELYYATYISKICNMLIELKISENPIETYKFLTLLYKSGNISRNRNYSYSTDEYVDVVPRGMLGASVVTGHAVCRHVVYLFQEILSALGYDVDIVFLNNIKIKEISSKDIGYTENIPVVLSCIDSMSEKEVEKYAKYSYKIENQDQMRKITGNHVVLGLNVNGKYVLLDPTNDTLLYNPSTFDNIGKLDSLYDEIKEFDISRKNTYKADDDTIVVSDSYNISIIKQAFTQEGINKKGIRYERGLSLDLMKQRLDRLIEKREKPIFDLATAKVKYNDKRAYIDDFYEKNSEFYKEFSNKVLSLTR